MVTLWLRIFVLRMLVGYILSSRIDLTVRDRLHEMERHLQETLEKYKLQLTSVFGEHPAFDERRSRRTPNETYPVPEPKGLLTFDERITINSNPSSYGEMKDVNFLIDVSYRNSSYFLKGTTSGNLILYASDFSTVRASVTIFATPYRAEYFLHEQTIWFVVLCNVSHHHFAVLYKTIAENKTLEKSQNITCDGPSDLQLLTLKRNTFGSDHYLIVSTMWNYRAPTILYKWKNILFDRITQVETDRAISIAAWFMDDRLHLIVAQETEDDGSIAASPVYTYNVHQSRLILVEYVQTNKPKKVKFMHVKDKNYVVFMSAEEVSVYSWTGRGFTEWIKFSVSDAVDIDVVNLSDGKAIIGVASKNSVEFYTEFAHTVIAAGRVELPGILRVSFFDSSSHLLITNEDISKVYDLSFNISTHSRPTDIVDPLVSGLLDLRSKINSRAKNIDYMLWNISRVWRYDVEQKIDAEIIIKTNVNIKSNVTLGRTYLLRGDEDRVTFDYEAVPEMIEAVRNLSRKMNSIVYKSAEQTIKGKIKFTKPIEGRSVSINRLSNDVSINEISLERLDKYALQISKDQILTGRVTLTNLTVDNLTTDGKIKGFKTEDLFLLKSHQTVRGNVTFSKVNVSGNITISGHINGIGIVDTVTTTHAREIRGVKTFATLRAKRMDVDGFINGKDLRAVESKAIFLGSPNRLFGNISLAAHCSIGKLLLKGLVNGRIDIQKLIEEGVSVNERQTITGVKTFFRTVNFRNDLNVEGRWNNINFSSLITTSTHQTITGKVIFRGPLYFNQDLETEMINSVNLREDAVLSFGEQVVLSKKHFESFVTVYQNITLGEVSTINGIRPSRLARLLEDILKGLPGYRNVSVTGNLCYDDLLDISELDIWRKSVMQTISVPVRFLNVRIDGDIYVDSINGVSTKEFVTRGDGVITGSLTFMDNIHATSNIAFSHGSTLNGFDLSENEKDIHIKEGVIMGKKIFKSLSVHGDIQSNCVNDIKLPEDIMLKEPQNITGHLKFDEVTIRDGLLEYNLASAKLNGRNIIEFLKDLVMKDVDSDTITSKTFINLRVLKDIMANGSIDGVPMEDLFLNVVTLNTPQTILAKNFTGNITFESPLHLVNLNGFYIENFTSLLVFDTTKTIYGKINILGNVTMLKMAEAKSINRVNFEQLQNDVISKSKKNIFRSIVNFQGSIEIGYLTVETTIDGVNLSDLVLLNSSHRFDEVTFISPVSTSNVDVAGLINNCNLTWQLENATPRVVSTLNLTQVTEITSLEVKDAFIKGKINDFDISSSKGWKNVKNGVYQFQDIRAKSLYVRNKVNNVNLTFLLGDSVQKNTEQKITGEKLFVNEGGIVLEKDLRIYGNLLLKENINKISWNDLCLTAVTRNGNQTISGTKTFSSVSASTITVKRLNNVRIPNDIILGNRNESIRGTTYIETLEIVGNLTVRGSVDGVDLHSFISRRFTLGTRQDVKNINFSSDVYVSGDLRIVGKVNDLDLIDIFSSTKILETTFTKYLTIIGNINIGRINTYNFTSLASTIVTTVDNAIIQHIDIQGPAAFYENLSFTDVNVAQFTEIIRRIDYLGLCLKTVAEEYSKLNAIYNKQVSYRLNDPHGGKTCGYAHFVLVTEPTPLAVWRFLPLRNYDRDPDTIIAWVSDSYYCTRYKSYSYRHGMNSFNKTDSYNGRYYPLFIPEAASEYHKGFVIRTKSLKECDTRSSITNILTLNTSCITNLYQTDTSVLKSLLIPSSPNVESSKLFIIEGNLYLVLVSSQEKYPDVEGSTRIYVFNGNETWLELQKINTRFALSVDVVKIVQHTYLAVANNRAAINCTNQSLVYEFNAGERKFSPVVPVTTSYASSVLFTKHNWRQFLLVGNNDRFRDGGRYKDPLLVYLHNGENEFRIVQRLRIYGVTSLEAFSIAGEGYVLAGDSIHQCIRVLQWQGYGRLKEIQSIQAFGIRNVVLYWTKNKLYAAVASSSGHSKILEVIVRGKCT